MLMRKLIKYPAQALSYLDKGQFIVLLTTDVERIANAVIYMPSFPVRIISFKL